MKRQRYEGKSFRYDNMLVSPACGNCVNSDECKNAEKLGWCSIYEFGINNANN